MSDKPTVFISYNWGSDLAATFLERSLDGIAEVRRDKKNIRPWGDIKAFMRSIKEQDLAVLVLSDSYLTSGNCMFELMELMKNKDWDRQVMYVVEDSAKGIYDTEKQLDYITYWVQKEKELEAKLEGMNPVLVKSQQEELDKRHLISSTIGDFMGRVQYINNPEPVAAIDEIVARIRDYHNAENRSDSNGTEKEPLVVSVEEFISRYKDKTVSEISASLGTTTVSTKSAIRKLVETGKIEPSGTLSGQNTRYRIKENKTEADLTMGPKFNVIFRGHSGALSDLYVKLTNVSNFIVSRIKNEVVSAVLSDGREIEIPSNPEPINHAVLDRMQSVEFCLKNDGFGKYKDGKYYDEYENYDLIWTFRCCDEDGNKYVYEVKKHIEHNKMNGSELNDGIICKRIA